MATCPNCNTSSRTDPDALSVDRVLEARPLGTWSLAGAQLKTSAVERLRLSCRCGWSVLGYVNEDEDFMGYPDTQTFPTVKPGNNPEALS